MENKNLKILAIDDNEHNLTSVKALIREAFPHALILTATEAGKGIELAQTENPDVILLDVVMPGMDGFEACQQLKADPLTRYIPVVFLTAIKGDKEARIRALEVGAEAFLSKPIDEVELATQIRAMQKIKAASERERAERENLTELVAARTRELELAHTATLNLLDDLRKENTARQKSEAHLRLLFENLPSGVVVHAADTAVQFANPEALRLLGLTLEQIQGKTATDPAWCFLREDGGSLPLDDYPVNRLRTSKKSFTGQIIGIRLPGRAEPNWVQCNAYPQLDANGQLIQVIVAFTDITARKQAGEALKRIEWLLTSRPKASDEDDQAYMPPYGNLVALNTCRLILDSVGEQTLADIARDYLRLLNTSSSVYEKNGDYALGIFSSGWCRTLDAASRRICGTNDNRTALDCGQWHCHESCWSRASKTAIETGQPTDIECDGGIRLYAVPIRVGGVIIGAINIGYGDPPRDEEQLRELASKYHVSYEELRALSMGYESRPVFITDLAKDRLQASARLIGVIIERKRAEEVLRESEERFKAIANYAVSWESWFGPEGKYIWVNPGVEHFTGYTAQEILAMPDFVSTVIADEDRAMFIGRFQEAIRGNREDNYEFRYLHKNGTKRWLSASWQPICDAQGNPLGTRSSGYDITERKQAEDALRESEARFRQMFEKHDAIMLLIEPQTGYIMDANQSAAKYYGYEKSKLLEMNINDINTLASEQVAEERRKALQEERNYFVFTHRLANGTERIVEVHSSPISVYDRPMLFSVIHDITERKLAEQALLKANKHLAFAQSAARAGMWDWDMATGILTWSPEMFKLFGFDPNTSSPTFDFWRSVLHPEDREKAEERINRSILEHTPLDNEYRIVTPSGPMVWISAQGNTFYASDGTPLRMSGVCIDITERKQAEEEMAKLEAQLRQAQKMESVGRLAGGVAHDFNNMLGIILGNLEMALEQINPAQPVFESLQEIRKAAERSADLTRQLLAFARKQTIAPKVIDLNETIEGMLKMLRRLIGEDIDLLWNPGRNPWPVKLDPSQLDQLLVNLCVNARNAIAGVGTITIETQAAVFDEAFCGTNPHYVPGEFVLLAVSDNGCGMDQEILGHLFEPFFTTKEVGKGTGLGMATVYGMVKQNNGFISVSSELGQGTTIKVYLPWHKAETTPLSEKELARPAERGHETILLVEDELALLKLTSRMLKKLGYTVIEAGTPGEAIRLASTHPDRVDLLMTDVVMPGMNGSDLAKNLLALFPDLKRLFMSGYTADVIAHHGVLDEGVHFIQKPFSLNDLGKLLRKALEV